MEKTLPSPGEHPHYSPGIRKWLKAKNTEPIIKSPGEFMDKRIIERRRLFVHAPYRFLDRYMNTLLEGKLQPEIYFSSRDLKGIDTSEAERLSRRLRDGDLECTFHGPFLDLNPGAVDQDVRILSLSRFKALLQVAEVFQPRAVIFHPGYDRRRYDGQVGKWLKESLKTWSEVLSFSRRLVPETKILLENIFEDEPSSLLMLLSRLEDDQAGFCFDTGHFLLFDIAGLDAWIENLGSFMMEIHLHDNNGHRDEHLSPGEGSFPFQQLFRHLDSGLWEGMNLVIEAHNRRNLAKALDFMSDNFTFIDYGREGCRDPED
jgi:sugar phosphate isomerase/epimerase